MLKSPAWWSWCALVWCACPAPVDPGSLAPTRVYWDIRQVGSDFAPLDGELPGVVPRFLSDGSIVGVRSSGLFQVRHPTTGEWRSYALPTSTTGGFPITAGGITWFKDAHNYGGNSVGDGHTLNGGWVVLEGQLHECEGDACTPIAQLADGTFVTRQWNSQYFMTWKPGENPAPAYPIIDDLDIHNYKLDLVNPCFAVRRVGDDGTVLLLRQENGSLLCRNQLKPLSAAIFKDFARVDVGKEQFNPGFNPDPTECCNVTAINDRGDILGLRDGLAVIKSPAGRFEAVSEGRASPQMFNERGDVLFRPAEGASRLRLAGETLEFPDCEVTKQVEGASGDLFEFHSLDMNEQGEVLFWRRENSGTSALYVATPRKAQVPNGVVGELSFAVKSGSDTPASLTHPWRVTGSLAGGSFALSAQYVTDTPCQDRPFVALATSSAGTWGEGALVSVVTGGGTIVGSASFSSAGATWVASAGGFRISDVGPSGFTATAEGLVFKKVGGVDTATATGQFRVTP